MKNSVCIFGKQEITFTFNKDRVLLLTIDTNDKIMPFFETGGICSTNLCYKNIDNIKLYKKFKEIYKKIDKILNF